MKGYLPEIYQQFKRRYPMAREAFDVLTEEANRYGMRDLRQRLFEG